MLEALKSTHKSHGLIISVSSGAETLRFRLPKELSLEQRHVEAAKLACQKWHITETLVSGKIGAHYVHVRVTRQS
jgi:hypothetical protein